MARENSAYWNPILETLPRERLRAAQRLFEPIVLAMIGTIVGRPHLLRDLQRLFQHFKANAYRWERDAQTLRLTFEPGRTNTQIGATA